MNKATTLHGLESFALTFVGAFIGMAGLEVENNHSYSRGSLEHMGVAAAAGAFTFAVRVAQANGWLPAAIPFAKLSSPTKPRA